VVGLDDDFFDVPLVELRHEVTENNFFFRRVRRYTEQIEQQDHEQADDDPEEQIFCPGIHPVLLIAEWAGPSTRQEIRELE
jgi:hypothetical protein